jgi:hypothetical protein
MSPYIKAHHLCIILELYLETEVIYSEDISIVQSVYNDPLQNK